MRQRSKQCVEIGRILHIGIHLAHLVLLLEFGDNRPIVGLLLALKVKSAEELRLRRQHADLPALRPRHDPDGPHQLILDGQPAIEERNHELLATGVEHHAEEDLVERRGLFRNRHPEGPDVIALQRLAGLRRILRSFDDPRVQRLAGHRIEFAQRRDQRPPHRQISARHLGAQVRMNEDGVFRIEALQEFPRIRGKRMDLFTRGIDAQGRMRGDRGRGAGNRQGAGEARQHMKRHPRSTRPRGPAPPPEQRHVGIKCREAEAHEVDNSAGCNDARCEIAELLHHR